jgi:menaquinone-dependent protoporphyrinogen oxidase
METILVSYASKQGSTEQIAQVLANILRKHDFEVHVLPANAVDSLNDYCAVVFGSAVYLASWTEDAMAFLKRFDLALQRQPVWLFSSGPTGEGDPSTILQGWKYPEAFQAYINHIRPIDIKLFHGKLELGSLSWVQRWLVKTIKAPVGDYRQWTEIEAWAETIAQKLHRDIQAVK